MPGKELTTLRLIIENLSGDEASGQRIVQTTSGRFLVGLAFASQRLTHSPLTDRVGGSIAEKQMSFLLASLWFSPLIFSMEEATIAPRIFSGHTEPFVRAVFSPDASSVLS